MRLRSAAGRRILAATILGSGAVFLEGTVAIVALPAIGRDFHLAIAGLQWVMNGYLLMLSALILFGGALGDRFSRARVFALGLIGFAVGSLCCAIAPSPGLLIVSRVVQGAAGALVVPNSLALLESTFAGEERGLAIGRWAAWSAISTAAGPLLGGWLVDAASWRFVFVTVIPFALVAAWIAFRHPDSEQHATRGKPQSLDYGGAALITLGFGALVAALISGPTAGFTSRWIVTGILGGILLLVAFGVVEARSPNPLLPPAVFRSRQFVGANLNTLLVYAALNGLFFLLMLQLQYGLGYGALSAGASLLPINFLLLVLSPWSGRVAERIGPRLPMAIGSLTAAGGMLLFVRVRPGADYLRDVLPAVVVFGVGLGVLVAPLTAAALSALGDRMAGVASGANNAVARLAGLLATAALPVAAGLGGADAAKLHGVTLSNGFARGMVISAAICAAGSVIAFLMIDRGQQGRAAH